jgi:hypothetical protein
MNLNTFLTNKWVAKFIGFLAVFNIIGYLVIGNMHAALYFIIFSFVLRYFSKNMTIFLGIPLIIINLLAINNIEGMETNTPLEEEQTKINKILKDNKDKPDQKTGQGLPMHPLEDSDNIYDNDAQTTGSEQQGFESGPRKNKINDIGNPATMDDAYDQMNNTNEIPGMKNVAKKLIQNEVQITKAIENMGTMMLNKW